MLKIRKEQTEFGYDFIISTVEGDFGISYQGNLDLYWRYAYQGNIMDLPESKTFTITKENYYIFSLFEKLYNDIKNYNIYELDEFDVSRCEGVEEIEALRLRKEEWNYDLKKREEFNPERLFHKGIVEWHCDDFPYEDGSTVKIKREKDTFLVVIEKSKIMDSFLNYSVRFTNSGSRYDPFNIIFMKMYRELIDYEPSYHQVHIEEWIYQKKLSKKK